MFGSKSDVESGAYEVMYTYHYRDDVDTSPRNLFDLVEFPWVVTITIIDLNKKAGLCSGAYSYLIAYGNTKRQAMRNARRKARAHVRKDRRSESRKIEGTIRERI